MSKQNYYEFFGLKEFEDDQLLIKKAYRSMMLKHHPDRNQGNEEIAEHMAKQINEVYRVLSKHKDEYDRHIGRRSTTATSSSSGHYESQTFNWEFNKSYDPSDMDEKIKQAWDELQKKHQAQTAQSSWHGSRSYRAKRTKGERKISETSLFEQQEAIDEIKTWTWDEFTIAKRQVYMKRGN